MAISHIKTFSFQGTANRVFFDLNGITDHHSDELAELRQISPGFWQITLEVPPGFMGSCSVMPIRETLPEFRDYRERWVYLSSFAEPLPESTVLSVPNGWGGHAGLVDMSDQFARWQIQSVPLPSLIWCSERLGNARAVSWLSTEATDAAPFDDKPWVFLLDGQDWLTGIPMAEQLRQLTQAGLLTPAHYVFIPSIDIATRSNELPLNPTFWDAVVEELLPCLVAAVGEAAKTTLVAGQSYGGLAAVYAALQYPTVFQHAISQSGSFWYPDRDAAVQEAPLHFQLDPRLCRHLTEKPASVVLQVGELEGSMLLFSEAMLAQLTSLDVPVQYHTFVGGHDRFCWFQHLLLALLEHPEMH